MDNITHLIFKRWMIFIGMLWLLLCKGPAIEASSFAEQLIVFLQPGASDVNQVFQSQTLPKIKDLAESMSIHLVVRDARKGAPAEVVNTPFMVYQNYLGRSFYQGRSHTISRIRNFIRTSRYVPQEQIKHQREDIAVRSLGRTQIWAPLKIASVTGARPEGYDDDTFRKEALKAVYKGLKKFEVKKQADLMRGARGFYMDFYPWRASDGTLFLSAALYSQYHCKKPVFEKKMQPLTGPWQKRYLLFQEAASLMEAALETIISNPHGGDGFDVVSKEVQTVRWEALGLSLPAEPARSVNVKLSSEILPRDWELSPRDVDASPMIMFRFPAPLDHYAGEVTDMSGELMLPEDLTLTGATGHVSVNAASVTMGEPELDSAIKGSLFLYIKQYGAAKFILEKAEGDGNPIAFGRLTPTEFKGALFLKGKNVPINAKMEIEPVLNQHAEPNLLLRGAFSIDLREFDIEGADGPAPQKDTLQFDLNFVMKEKGAKDSRVQGAE